MTPDRRAVTGLLFGGAALLAVSALEAAEAGPVEIITDIYRRASSGKGTEGGTFLIGTKRARRAAFSRRTADLWDAKERKTQKGDAGPMEFDPVSNSQDPDIRSFSVVAEEMAGDRARVAATIRGRTARPTKADETIRYLLVREGGRWLIDDIRGTAEGEGWSVRQILEAF